MYTKLSHIYILWIEEDFEHLFLPIKILLQKQKTNLNRFGDLSTFFPFITKFKIIA